MLPGAELVRPQPGVLVHSHDALVMPGGPRGEGGGQGGGALLQVPGLEARLACARDREGKVYPTQKSY